MKSLKYIYISTFLFWLATNLFSPFLAIFATTQIPGVGITEIGISSMLFFLSFGISVMIFSRITDKIRGLKDDFIITFLGFVARGGVLILFAFAQSLSFFFIAHFLLGVTRGLTDASQDKIISKLSKDELLATSFGFRIGIVNFAAALGAGIGGYLIDLVGFRIIMGAVGILTIFAGILFFQNRKVV